MSFDCYAALCQLKLPMRAIARQSYRPFDSGTTPPAVAAPPPGGALTWGLHPQTRSPSPPLFRNPPRRGIAPGLCPGPRRNLFLRDSSIVLFF